MTEHRTLFLDRSIARDSPSPRSESLRLHATDWDKVIEKPLEDDDIILAHYSDFLDEKNPETSKLYTQLKKSTAAGTRYCLVIFRGERFTQSGKDAFFTKCAELELLNAVTEEVFLLVDDSIDRDDHTAWTKLQDYINATAPPPDLVVVLKLAADALLWSSGDVVAARAAGAPAISDQALSVMISLVAEAAKQHDESRIKYKDPDLTKLWKLLSTSPRDLSLIREKLVGGDGVSAAFKARRVAAWWRQGLLRTT